VRALLAASVLMGVLIVAGVAVLATVAVRRATGPRAAEGTMVLDEPAGTRIAAASGVPESLVVVLSGAGPDRVVVVDARHGRVTARLALAR
jgi:hypothetical protein